MSDRSSRKLQICAIYTVPEPRHTLLMLSGEVDMAAESELAEVLDQVSKGPAIDVVADLTEVAFLGSHGLDFLVQLHLRVTRAGRNFTVFNPSGIARRALEVSGLDQVLAIDQP